MVVRDLAARYLTILHDSPHYIAVRKPPFTICQDELENPSSLSNLLRLSHPHYFTGKEHPFHAPKGVHRLDALVTGCVLYGTSVYGTRQLAKNFKKRKVEKGYIALLQPLRPSQSILEERDSGSVETLDRVTRWTVLARLETRERRLCVCWLSPVQGRNHQLRIHAAEDLQAPVLFDRRYPFQQDNQRRDTGYEQVKEEGIALHCASLTFPLGLERQSVSCVPPDYGIWKKVAEEYEIDWQRVVDEGNSYRHASLK